MRRPLTVLVLSAGLGVGGCGGPSDETKVRATLTDLARATAQRDYGRLCRQVLAPRLVEAVTQTGLACPAALAQGLGRVAAPTLTVRGVSVHGRVAFATVHTTATNQPASDDTVGLIKIGSRWFVQSLVTPVKRPA